jgi:hypothetical protein
LIQWFPECSNGEKEVIRDDCIDDVKDNDEEDEFLILEYGNPKSTEEEIPEKICATATVSLTTGSTTVVSSAELEEIIVSSSSVFETSWLSFVSSSVLTGCKSSGSVILKH